MVVLGYCCGFLVKEGFAWVGGIAAVGRQRVKIGDKGPLDWFGERGEDTIPWERQHGDRPNETGPRPPACERVPRCRADRHAAKRGGESGESGTCFWEFVERLDGGLTRISKYRGSYQESTVEG